MKQFLVADDGVAYIESHAHISVLQNARLVHHRSTINFAIAFNRTCAADVATCSNARSCADECGAVDHSRAFHLRARAAPYARSGFNAYRTQTTSAVQTVFHEFAEILRLAQTVDVSAIEEPLLLRNKCAQRSPVCPLGVAKKRGIYQRYVE